MGLKPAFLDKLLRLTMELEQEAGWGVASSGLFALPLHRRSVESIRYTGAAARATPLAREGGGGGAVEIGGYHSKRQFLPNS